MTLGTGLFLSAVVLAIVLLYWFTKDRWRWRRIVVLSSAAVFGMIALVAVAAAIIDRRSDETSKKRVAADRAAHEVHIGDHYNRVLQRQGRPDTTVVTDTGFVIGYWDEYETLADTEKVFFFGSDSVLTEIRFIGESYETIEYGWVPEDGVELGMPKDSVMRKLGAPCRQEVNDERTLLVFRTRDPSVTRFTSINHGAGVVIRHGWSRDGCAA